MRAMEQYARREGRAIPADEAILARKWAAKRGTNSRPVRRPGEVERVVAEALVCLERAAETRRDQPGHADALDALAAGKLSQLAGPEAVERARVTFLPGRKP
jgi:hypothetical protein